jgi:hypothetical protein
MVLLKNKKIEKFGKNWETNPPNQRNRNAVSELFPKGSGMPQDVG